MDASLSQSINYELKMLEYARKKYAQRLVLLRDCKDTFLRRSKHGDSGYFFYIKRKGAKSYEYLGREEHPDIKRVKEARFIEKAIRRIDCDIELYKALSDGFLSFDPSSISESLPETYRCEVPPVSELYEREGAKWKADMLKLQKEFPENYPKHKKHRTSDGVMVKTISELTLYERFKSAGLIQIYELPLPMKDYGPPLYPDSTILSPIDIKTRIIVEFVGRLDLPEYREDFARKVGRYMASGYIPGVNLYFVFSDKNGNIDSMQITKVIADIIGIRN